MTESGVRDPFPATVEVKRNERGLPYIEIVEHDGTRWVLSNVSLIGDEPDLDPWDDEPAPRAERDVTPRPKALEDGA